MAGVQVTIRQGTVKETEVVEIADPTDTTAVRLAAERIMRMKGRHLRPGARVVAYTADGRRILHREFRV